MTAQPTPTSDDATPAPLPIAVLGGVLSDDTAVAYVEARLKSDGTAIRDGGYEVVQTGTATHRPPRTLLLCPPQFDHEAFGLQQILFPGALGQEPCPTTTWPSRAVTLPVHRGSAVRDHRHSPRRGWHLRDRGQDLEEGSGRLRHETLAVGDHDPEDGAPEILAATRNE